MSKCTGLLMVTWKLKPFRNAGGFIKSVFDFDIVFVIVVLKNKFLKKYNYIWLVGFKYMFGKNYNGGLYTVKNIYKMFSCGCFLKVLFT